MEHDMKSDRENAQDYNDLNQIDVWKTKNLHSKQDILNMELGELEFEITKLGRIAQLLKIQTEIESYL